MMSQKTDSTISSSNNNNNDRVRQQLMILLARSGLPKKLVDRLLFDIDGGHHYSRVASIEELKTVPPNSSYWGTSCACCYSEGVLVEQGKLGKLRIDDEFYFLAPGYHKYSTLGAEFLGSTPTAIFNAAVVHGPSGFVTITEGHIGVLLVGAEYKLLAPGTYCWNSNSVRYVETVDVTKTIAKLGVFTLVTVPDGLVAITYLNGNLKILGHRTESTTTTIAAASTGKEDQQQQQQSNTPVQRTFFLDDPKWNFSSFLSMKCQADRLEDIDVLSSDNVEMLLVALGEWKIIDPVLAINEFGDDMEMIRVKVDALMRATISRIVAGTAIGTNVSGATATDPHHHHSIDPHHQKAADGPDLSHLMQSSVAIQHMTELSKTLRRGGLISLQIFVPEKRMKNDDIRREVARQSIIGIKAEAERSASDAQAYATTTSARAQAEAMRELAQAEAFATTTRAKAEAQAIEAVSEAHAQAGKKLGNPNDTAARLALSEVVAKSFKDAKVTLFSGTPDKMPFMFSNEMK